MNSYKICFMLVIFYLQMMSNVCHSQEGFWNSAKGIEGGDIHSITSNSKGDIFVITFGHGLYRSTDKGESWISLGQNLPQLFLPWHVFVDSADNIYLYSYDTDAIYKSADYGNNWEKINLSFHNALISTFAENSNRQLFCSINGWLYRSSDFGETWTNIYADSEAVIKLFYRMNIFLGIRGNKLFKISEDGSSWNELTNFTTLIDSLKISLSSMTLLAINKNHTILVGDPYNIFISKDIGNTWHHSKVNFINFVSIYDVTNDENGNFYLTGLLDSYHRLSRILKSTDEGETWYNCSNTLHDYLITNLFCDNMNNIFAGTSGGGVLLLKNGNLIKKNNNLCSATVNDLVYKNNNEMFCCVQGDGIFYSSNGGFDWFKASNYFDTLNVGHLAITPTGVLYAGTSEGLFRSTDNGVSWNLVFTNIFLPNVLIDRVKINHQGIIAIIVTKGGLITSSDGNIWKFLVDMRNIDPWYSPNLFLTDNNCLVSNINLEGFQNTGLVMTKDFGNNWTCLNNPVKGIPSDIYFDDSLQIVEDNRSIFLSTNFGSDWHKIFIDSVSTFARPTPLFCSDSKKHVYVNLHDYSNNNESFYYSNNLGKTFNKFYSTNNLNTLKMFSSSDDRLYIAPQGFGLLKYNGDFTSDVTKEIITSKYKLYQNYPNPFNPTTTINYSIPIESFVTIKIYDLLGKEVATLVNEFQKPGTYNYQLSTSNYQLSSGVYFYQLQAGNFIATKKLILLK